jgi:hypothetical protein
MAVRVLPRSQARPSHPIVTVPLIVLGVALLPPAVDLLARVQSDIPLTSAADVVGGLACAALLVMWLRFPRTTWLMAACFAAAASLALRLVGVNLAPVFALLSILALGVGGAFGANDVAEPEESL